MAEQDEPVRWFDRVLLRMDLIMALLIAYGLVTYVIWRDLADLQVSAGVAVICSMAHGDDVWASARWMLARARGRVHDGGTPPAQG